MSEIQTFEGWTSLETGHLTPQYDQNFVVYTNSNRIGAGINCKIRIFDLVQSDVREYLSRGGMCRVIVRGIMRIAPTTEQGWIPTSTHYLQVTWIMQEQQPEFSGGEDIITSQQERKSQQQQSNTISINNDADSEDITEEKEPQSQDEDEDNDSDPNYSSIDVEEEERTRRNDTDFDDYDDSKDDDDDDDISLEDIEKLKAAANEPLPMQESTKKRDAEYDTEVGSNKKQKQNTPVTSSCSSNVIALE